MRDRLSTGMTIALIASLSTILLIEAGGRVFLVWRPSYDVLFLQPDREVGWMQVPNLEWTWAGSHWYAMDFSVPITTNSEGFRDQEREPSKRPRTVRVALLGDSFVEAVQVSLPKTAGQILQTQLNASPAGEQFEVLNFGISNYGVGQYLLVWEHHARRYSPDYVFALVAEFHMRRSTNRFERGGFRYTAGKELWIRPTFRLQDGFLIREPARDFDEFVRAQEKVIRTEFAGSRIRKRESSLLGHYLRQFRAVAPASAATPKVAAAGQAETPTDTTTLNLAILRELGNGIRAAGAKLIVADFADHFPGGSSLSRILARFCTENEFGYVALGRQLRVANRHGIPTHWRHDGHFNEAGNAIFADSMYGWLKENAAQVRASGAPRGE